jgi:hypothetical protein
MKRVSLVCFLVILSFAGPCLFQLTAGAQEPVGQESQVQVANSKTEDSRQQSVQAGQSKTQVALEHKAKKNKAKKGKGKISPMICNDCDPGDGGGGGGGGGGYTGDGHIWCDGWNRQGDCVFNHVNASTSVEFRRQMGNNGYDFQTYLTWFPWETDGFGRFPVPDGNVGLISTQPLAGQVALHRWSTRRGFYYSVVYEEHGGDYVYGGVAGYVYPPGDNRGFPLFQFYSDEYGHYYTSYPNEINCQPRNVYWDFQGEMARVNFPAPFSQAFRQCRSFTFPGPCDPFAKLRCEARGIGFWIAGNCTCSDGLF